MHTSDPNNLLSTRDHHTNLLSFIATDSLHFIPSHLMLVFTAAAVTDVFPVFNPPSKNQILHETEIGTKLSILNSYQSPLAHSAMASPSSSRPSPPLTRSPLFTPIPELDAEEEVEENEPEQENKHHQPTPMPTPPATAKKDDRQLSVLLDKCRPSSRDKPSVVPIDNLGSGSTPTINPKTILHSFLLTLTRSRSPKTPPTIAATSSSSAGPTDEWKLAAQELTRKLALANRRRDEALVESARLKATVADLERKLDRLESHCLDLQAQLDRATVPGPAQPDPLPAAVSEARAAVRSLARSLSAHVRSGRIASVLKFPVQNTANLLVYMEALLNRVFYEDFEKVIEEERKILDPAVRCEANRAGYEAVRGLAWEDVLSKGTKHYSEGLSRFCDQKMSEVVGLMGWARPWPEGLLQAFFGAAKGAWGVYLLARCVHPAVPILWVERGAEFDGRYMEDVIVGERVRSGEGTAVSVRVMVAPGFYLHAGSGGGCVIKSKVVCGCGGGNGEGENIRLNKIGCD